MSCRPPSSEADVYVGSVACQSCHPGAYEVYQKTAHAHAWKTLEDAGKMCDLGCIGCHTVGYEKPGGFCRLVDAEKNKNVGCENCHGPGRGHISNPHNRSAWSSLFKPNPGSDVCISCHNQEHSDQFDFKKYLPQVLGEGHGL